MTETTTRTAGATAATAPAGRGTHAASAPRSALVSEHGSTTITDTVVAKIAGLAARDVRGVHALGGGTARAVGALRERIPGGRVNHAQGISVEVGERQAAVDVELIAEYGAPIAELATAVRRSVIAAVERMTGLEVTEVDIEVSDVHLPEQDDEEERAPRVR